MGVPVSVAAYVVGGSHISGVVYLFPQQVTLRENFHASGAILGDEGPAVASFYCYHGAPLKNVVHEPLAVAECGNDEGERVHVSGIGVPSVIFPCGKHLREGVFPIRRGGGQLPGHAALLDGREVWLSDTVWKHLVAPETACKKSTRCSTNLQKTLWLIALSMILNLMPPVVRSSSSPAPHPTIAALYQPCHISFSPLLFCYLLLYSDHPGLQLHNTVHYPNLSCVLYSTHYFLILQLKNAQNIHFSTKKPRMRGAL